MQYSKAAYKIIDNMVSIISLPKSKDWPFFANALSLISIHSSTLSGVTFLIRLIYFEEKTDVIPLSLEFQYSPFVVEIKAIPAVNPSNDCMVFSGLVVRGYMQTLRTSLCLPTTAYL
jgi:hypothetical protein